jgi:hypothetical protein
MRNSVGPHFFVADEFGEALHCLAWCEFIQIFPVGKHFKQRDFESIEPVSLPASPAISTYQFKRNSFD